MYNDHKPYRFSHPIRLLGVCLAVTVWIVFVLLTYRHWWQLTLLGTVAFGLNATWLFLLKMAKRENVDRGR